MHPFGSVFLDSLSKYLVVQLLDCRLLKSFYFNDNIYPESIHFISATPTTFISLLVSC